MNAFPLSAANPCRCFFLLTICMQLSMWINGDWRVAESGWCKVINQHNECRWARCRWSPQSGLCHPAGSRCLPSLASQCLTARLNSAVIKAGQFRNLFQPFFFPFIPYTFSHNWKKKNVRLQFLFKSTVWIWMWHDKPELSVKHRSGSVFCCMGGRCHPRNCGAQENWQRLRDTTTSARAINTGKWASGHIVN